MKNIIATVGLTLAVAACNQEAGRSVDVGTFGDATMNNTLLQSGERDYAIALGKRFASQVPTVVNFEFDSIVLDAAARQILDQQADWIRQFPEVRFRVYGFTDLVGTAAYNKRLGLRRAQTVVRYLSSQGIKRSRLEAVVSFGETRPVIDTTMRERANRRALTEVTGFVKRNPTVLDGKYAEIVYREYIASAVPPSGLSGREDTGGFAEQQ